jgi:DNA polymerase-3 subunit gamma/tau
MEKQAYQVIPRKFRPQTFDAVVGQEPIVTTLKNAIRFNRLAHAYLFCGCRGTGKTTLARVFAKALNCHQLTENFEPCNLCSSCSEIISGRSLDVLEIDGASNRGIDDIRQINETIGYAPASGKFKIYIIDEVHMLTKEAFNALLKTLEEPPVNVKFFFATTEPHKVLPTIISRCQRFDLNRIAQTSMVQKLSHIVSDLNIQCEEEALVLIAHLSEGSLRDAESLLDQVICYAEQPITAEGVSHSLGLLPKEIFFSLDRAIAEHQCGFAFDLAQTLFTSGKDLSYFVDHLLEHFRTLLVVKLDKPSFFLNADHEAHYRHAATLYSEEQCLYILDYLIQWQQQIAKSPFKRIGLEMILLHLIRSKNRITFGTLVKKLSEIQTQANTSSPSSPAPHALNLASQTNPSPMSHEKTPSVEEVLFHKVKNQVEQRSTITEESSRKPEGSPVEEQPAARVIEDPILQHSEKLPEVAPEVKNPTFETKPLKQETTQAPHQGRYETLIRFASVELEGIIK